MNKTALIVETREHSALPMVLNSVRKALTTDWKLQVFHGNKNIDYVKKISDTEWGEDIILTPLGFDELPQWPESNNLMVSKEFWKQIEGETILYFETDCIICYNSEYLIEDFEKFDFIGGFWGSKIPDLDREYNWIMNGGLSLRKKSFLLDSIKYKHQDYLKRGGNPCEDYFFSSCIENKPLVRDVLSFSIDNGYVAPQVGIPFGLHKPWGEHPHKGHGMGYPEIKKVCQTDIHGSYVEDFERLHNV